MPTGPGDDILSALDAGKADSAIMKQYGINDDQLKSFKSLQYGLSNQKIAYTDIAELYPELNNYFKPPAVAAPVKVSEPEQVAPQASEPKLNAFQLVQNKVKLLNEQREDKEAARSNRAVVMGTDQAMVGTEYNKPIEDIDRQLKEQGYDPKAVTTALGDLPNLSSFDYQKALDLQSKNPLQFDRYKAAIKSQYDLLHAVDKKEGPKAANDFIAHYQQQQIAPDYETQRQATRDAVQSIYKYVDDNKGQRKILADMVRDKAFGYGVGLPGQDEAIANDPRAKNFNPYQVTALQFLEDTDPGTAQAYERLLNFTPDEVKQLSMNSSFERGFQVKGRELENIGMNLMRKSIEEKLVNMLADKDKWDDKQKADYQKLYEKYETLSNDYNDQGKRYPAVAAMDSDRLMQQAMGETKKGIVAKTALGIGENVDDAVTWIGDLLQSPFQSKKESALDDLQLLGDKRLGQLSQYELEGQELFGGNYKTVFDKEMQDKVAAIKNNPGLTNEEKQDKVRELLFNDNMQSVKFVPNDKEGKMNFTGQSVLNSISNTISEIAPQVALAYISGGTANASKVGELTSLFGSTFATAYNDYYVQALEENKPHPSQYALINTTIEAASELINNDVEQAKKLFAGKKAGQLLEGVTQQSMNALTKTGRFAALKETLKEVGKMGFKNAAKETYEELAGQAASNLANKQLFNEDVDLTDDLLKTGVSTFIGMLPLAGAGLPFHYKEATTIQKQALYQAALNPDKFIAQVDSDLKNNAISSSEAEARKAAIEKASSTLKSMSVIRPDGTVMSDNQKVNYLYNQYVKSAVKESKKTATEKTNESLETIEENLDNETNELLKPDKNESETKAETRTDAEAPANGTGVEQPGPENTSQPVAETQQGVGGESAPVADMHYTNPEGTSYILRGEDLFHVAKDGKETKFSEKAMQTKSTQELITKIKEANKQPSIQNQLEALPPEQWQELRNNLPGDRNINTMTDMVNAYNNGDPVVVDAVNKYIQPQSQQNAIQKQSTKGIHVPTSSGNSQALGAGNESQGTVNEASTGAQKVITQKPTPQQAEHYEASIGVAPNQHTGRIAVDPIVGGTAKKLYDIIATVSKGLKQRVTYAKIGLRVLGAYLPGFKGIKIRFNGDLDTTAHELGHAIDDHFDIYTEAAKDPDILQELDQFAPHGSTPPAGHPNPRRYIDKEGFAEWMRAYIVNPDAARKAAPKTTALYESITAPKFQAIVKQFSDDFRTWAGATGIDQILANVRTEYENNKGLFHKLFQEYDNNSNFIISWVDRLAANYINPLHAFEKAFNYAKGIRGIDEVLPEKDPIILSRIINGIAGKFGEILKSGMIDGRNNVLTDADGNPMNLKWLLAPFDNTDEASIKKDMKDTVAYMIAERTVELAGKFQRGEILTGAGAGVYSDFSVAQKALNEFYNGDPIRLARIQEAAKRYREFADGILKYAVDKGRMSQDQYNQIKADNTQYVAMQRMLETAPGQEVIVYPGKGEKPLGSKAEITHRQTGSTKATEHPYANLLDILYKTVRESDRNEVMRAFRDILYDPRFSNEGAPKRYSDIGEIAHQGDKETIPIFIDGKVEHWRFQEDVYKQLKALDKDAFKVWDFLTMPAKVLRFTTTHFPTFAIRNWIRDLQDRMIKSTTGSGIKALFGNKEDWNAIARAGGLNSGYYMKSKEAYYGLLTEAMGEMTKNKNIIIADPVRLKHLWHRYEDLLYKGETSNRVAEYRSAFKEAKDKGMDDYNASIYAAFKARDLIDFAIAGHHMQRINQVIPFTNAAVQGLRSAAVSFKQNPAGFLFKMMLYSVVPGVVSWFMNHHDDDTAKQYEEKPAYERDMFWNFRIGPNKWLAIPKPYELALPQMGMDRLLSYSLADNKQAFDGYGGTVKKLLLPLDEGNAAGPYQAVVEGLANKDFFRDRTVIPPNEDPLDLSLRHTETASRLGQLLQNFSGWDARKWDHFVQRQFSYTGNFALKLSDIGKEKGRHEFDLTDTGLFKRSPAYNAKSVQDMIDFAKRFQLDRTPAYKEFNGIVGEYFNADTDEEREEIGKKMIDYSKELLAKWKEKNVEEHQVQRFEAKKAGQHK